MIRPPPNLLRAANRSTASILYAAQLIARLFKDMNDIGVRHTDRIRALPDLPRRRRVKLECKILGQKIKVEL